MNPEVGALLEKAKRSRKAASRLLKDGDVDFAASRAYYAMFYVAEALLLSKNLSFSSHAAVIANFGKEFAKPGILNAKFHKYLIDAQDRRNVGDYSIRDAVSREQVEEMLAWIKEFLQVAERYLAQEF
jgi:uncharacterized protein (UPF0332 family)